MGRIVASFVVSSLVAFSLAAHTQDTSTASSTAQDLPTQQTTAIQPDFARNLALNAVAAMGTRIPVDLVATGSAQLVAGSKTETATITVRTRGPDQSSEEIQRADGTTTGMIFSRGDASEITGGVR